MKSKRPEEVESTDRAVSPVIGVILMVAITVILAAVIAAFVLDIGPDSSPINANVDIDEDGEDTTIEVQDMSGADELVIINQSNGASTSSSVDASTGQTFDVGDDFDVSESGDDEDYTVYAIQGSIGEGESVDDADGNQDVGTFTVESS